MTGAPFHGTYIAAAHPSYPKAQTFFCTGFASSNFYLHAPIGYTQGNLRGG